MHNTRKLIIRSLQNLLLKKRLDGIHVTNELWLRETFDEKTVRRYLKAVGMATGVWVEYDNRLTVGGLIEATSKP